MSDNYLPTQDAALARWAHNFANVLDAHLAETGLSPADVASLADALSDLENAIGDAKASERAYRATVETKRAAQARIEAIARPLVNRVQVAPGTTDALRANLGVPIRQTGGRGRGASHAARTDVPGVVLVARPGQVVVHWGTDPGNEQRNTRPKWARGAQIYRKLTGETDWVLVAFDTASPWVDTVAGPAVMAAYRVAYRGTGEADEGPHSPEQAIAAGG